MSLILLNSEFEVEKTQTYSWNILADVEKALGYSWHIHEYIEKVFSYSWTIIEWIEKALSYSWEIRKWVEKSLLYSWIISLIVGAVRYEFSSPKRQDAFYISILNKVFRLRKDIICWVEKALPYSWIFEECIEDPNMACDYVTGAETIGQSESVVVAITGLNTPFDWSVTGTGFTLEHATTTGLTNNLIADATACGTATITVVGCDGVEVICYVRGLVGQWVLISETCELPGAYDTVHSYGCHTCTGGNWCVTKYWLIKTLGNKKQKIEMYNCGTGHYEPPPCSEFCADTSFCEANRGLPECLTGWAGLVTTDECQEHFIPDCAWHCITTWHSPKYYEWIC